MRKTVAPCRGAGCGARYICFTELAAVRAVTLYGMEERRADSRSRSPHQKDSNMLKPMERVSTLLTVRNGLLLSLVAATLLAGCVAEVRPAYSPPPPPPAYSPPPQPAYAPPPTAEYDASAPAPEIQEQATEPPPPLPDYQQPPC